MTPSSCPVSARPAEAANCAVIDACFSLRVSTHRLQVDIRTGPGLTVLFGPSGSGKSLTLSTIAGLRRPDSGRVLLYDRTVANAETGVHVPTQQRCVGMVFQDSLLLPHRTVLDNVKLAVRSGTKVEQRESARHWLDLVGAREFASTYPHRLSGGERQRVAFARALAGNPQVLLLDEPFSALDSPTRRELRRLLRVLVDETGVGALLVTHDAVEAAELADTTIHCRDWVIANRNEPGDKPEQL